MAAYRRALTIAGSDSGGGAGIQADLKTFSALGCYGMSVITALTAQNTREVTAVMPVPPATVEAQIDAVFSDIGTDSVKLGMLHNEETIVYVARSLIRWRATSVVADPVMVAKSGDHLLAPDAVNALRNDILPIADLISPNLPEASALLGRSVEGRDSMALAAKDLLSLGPRAVLVKGGHLSDESMSADLLALRNDSGDPELHWLEYPRIDTQNTHGTGCTLSSAIAAYLAYGHPMLAAVRQARDYMQGAIEAGADYRLGGGHGPVHHFYRAWRD